MSALLPALLAVPVILTFIFETPLFEYLRSFTKPNADGNVGLAGSWILAFRRHTLRITDRLVGAVGQEEARSDMQAKWQEHGEKHGTFKLHAVEKQSVHDIALQLRSSLTRKLRVTTVTADMPGGAAAVTAEQE